MRTIRFLCAAALALGANTAPALAQEYQWRAVVTLVSGSLNSCGFAESRDITVKNGVLVARDAQAATWRLKIDRALKADGSGRIVGKLSGSRREVYFDFEPGSGPRPIRVDMNTSCVYLWSPS